MSLLTRTDVTAVKLYDSFIIAGVGSKLEVYERDSGKFIQKMPVLRGQKIYGIVPSYFESKILVFGGKQFTIFMIKDVTINTDEDSIVNRDIESIVCDDWLHSGVWLSLNTVAFMTAHNVVQIWNTEMKLFERRCVCSDNSILYSGLLLPLQGDLLVFSGTVFSEVIIQWCGDDKPLQYLKGHKGVIFSITCEPRKNIIVTTSDDRSLRIWSIRTSKNYHYTSKNYWQNAEIVCVHELYGHSARVMRNCITEDYVISIGEDAGICFWDLEGKLLKKLMSHQNACIWALDANDKYLVTGGGDSGVILHPLSLLTEYSTNEIVDIDINSVKTVQFTAKGNIVIINENDLIYHNLKSKTNEVHKLNHKSTYILLCLSTCKQIIAVVDMTGKLAVFIENCKEDAGIKKILNMELNLGNVLSMQWASNRHLVVCSENGAITILAAKESDIDVLANFILPPCKERWLTSSVLSDNNDMLVVSDRSGRLHIYKRGNKNTLKTFDKVHGRYGATSIKIRNSQIITTGRNGNIKYFSINKQKDEVKYMNSIDLDFQWVEKFLDKNENYICGFQERVFVVYDIKNNLKVLEVNCGGGHRSWDAMRYFEKVEDSFEEFIRLIYVKNSEVHLETFQLSKILSKNIIYGTHSKEINCLKTYTLDNNSETVFYISGGEDTTLRISRLSLVSKFRNEIIFKQLSSVKTLKVLPLEDNKILLVSAGGRAQICAKIITFNDDNITSQELVDYLIKGTDKERKGNRNWKQCSNSIDFDPETRIMDLEIFKIDDNKFSIITGCSDSVLRIFKLQIISKPDFKMIKEIKHHKTCVLKTHLFNFNDKDILATATSRGNVAFWNIDKVDLDIIFEMKTNKSGINSIDVKVISENKLLIATGGDDNEIHLNVLEIENDDLKSMKIIDNWSSDRNHCSQITGLKLVEHFLVATSIDQRITVFKLSIQNNICCEFVSQSFSDVADIQGIDVLSFNEDCMKVCVFGKGLEVLDVPCNANVKS